MKTREQIIQTDGYEFLGDVFYFQTYDKSWIAEDVTIIGCVKTTPDGDCREVALNSLSKDTINKAVKLFLETEID
jgi:hypothetical protein